MDTADTIDQHLKSAQAMERALAEDSLADNAQLAWLERQLASIIAQLNGLKEDLDCGWSPSGVGGAFAVGEIEEMLDDFASSIANLKSLIQTAKMISR